MWSSLYADSCNEAQRACFARAMRGIARACNATVHVSGTVAADKKKSMQCHKRFSSTALVVNQIFNLFNVTFHKPFVEAVVSDWTIQVSRTCCKRSNNQLINARSADSRSTLRSFTRSSPSNRLRKLVSTSSIEGDCWLKRTNTANSLIMQNHQKV